MDINIGLVDRSLRIGVGVLLLVLVMAGRIGAWGYIGVIPLFTGLVARCPLYTLFNVRTCKRDQA